MKEDITKQGVDQYYVYNNISINVIIDEYMFYINTNLFCLPDVPKFLILNLQHVTYYQWVTYISNCNKYYVVNF